MSPVEEIKQRLSVLDVVQSYIKLEKAGANYKARCPFHSEKTPSFFVSPSRDIWHCFGCGKGGDIFGFVMEIEGVEFIEALRLLADKAGVKLKTEDSRFKNERIRLFELLKTAADFYRKELGRRKNVLEYLQKRGLKDSTIQSYFLGYAPEESGGWRNLCNFLKSKEYSGEEMEKAGLAVKSGADYYDRFRGRIMFPLFDFSGRIVGFSGRLYPEPTSDVGKIPTSDVKAKYINTPQTILYDKSRILYGFDRAKTEIRKKDACILVEGQMDVLMSHQAGVLNAVAVSGTGLTPYHLNSIGRLTNNLIVAFDSDEAGLIAAGRGIDLALQGRFEIKVISLETEKDPAEVINKNPAAWQKAIQDSRPIIDFYLYVLAKNSDARIFRQKVGKIVLPYLLLIESEIDRNHWVKEIAKRLDIREESVWEELKKTMPPKPGFEGSKPGFGGGGRGRSRSRRRLLEERILGIVFWRKNDNLIPEKYKNLLGKGREDGDRLAIEAEVIYEKMEKEDLEKEIKILLNELERETIKEGLQKLLGEIHHFEAKRDEKALNEKLNEFRELSRHFNRLFQSNEIKKEKKEENR
jgi:DNA primase